MIGLKFVAPVALIANVRVAFVTTDLHVVKVRAVTMQTTVLVVYYLCLFVFLLLGFALATLGSHVVVIVYGVVYYFSLERMRLFVGDACSESDNTCCRILSRLVVCV